MKKLQLTYEKPLRHPKADEDERGIFRDKMAAYGSQHRTIVYSDESGFAHDMSRGGGTPRLLWFSNDGAGNLTAQADIVTPGLWDGAVALGDLDNDGRLDLIATGQDGSGSGDCSPQGCKWTGHRLYLFWNNGTGGFNLWQEPWGAGHGFAQ